MLNKNFFFHNHNLKEFNQNLKKTKKVFEKFKLDLDNYELPLLSSYEKNFDLDFTSKTIKKFSKYKNIIIVGMGGSILGTKSIYSFFKKKIKKNLFFFDNLDPNLYFELRKINNLSNSCYIVVSKSGNTIETIANLEVLFKNLSKNKLIFITEFTDSRLMNFANKHEIDVIEHKEFIGGRYSVLSEVGMFPAKLMGLDIQKFKNLKKLINNKNFVSTLIQNVASIYTLTKKKIKNSVILNYDSCFYDLSYWYQQLIGESLGKKNIGITPIVSFAPRDHHSLLQLYLEGPKDKFFTFFNSSVKEKKYKNLKLIIDAQSNALQNVFKKRKIPFRNFIFKKMNEEELGTIFTFFVLETILLSRLTKVNPFDQPAVEQVKIETKKILT